MLRDGRIFCLRTVYFLCFLKSRDAIFRREVIHRIKPLENPCFSVEISEKVRFFKGFLLVYMLVNKSRKSVDNLWKSVGNSYISGV